MNIQGLQKLTLLDYPGKMACTVFLSGCNFRCPFCHNGDLVLPSEEQEGISEEKLLSFLKKRQGILDGVCITGGEPLLRPDLAELMERIRALGFSVKLDTNGSRPDRLKDLVERGLVDYVAMDIKNAPSRYAETVGVPDFDLTPVQESVEFLLSGAVDYEFRTTVVSEYHTSAEIQEIGKWILGAKRYFLQAFVDSGRVLQGGLHAPETAQLQAFCRILEDLGVKAELRGVKE